jgi:hypothetical protein
LKRMIPSFAGILLLMALAPMLFAAEPAFTEDFAIDKADLSSTGRNPFFILEPGYQLYFKSADGDLTITVLNDTKIVDGVETRIVEERETEGGKLIEVSRNYFAMSKRTNGVFYFGEDVDMYDKSGKISGHGGSWNAGVDGARAGLAIPSLPLLGARYYQEVAPKLAMDRAEIVSISDKRKVAAGDFEQVLKTEETTPLEPGVKEYKYYAPGVGLIKDGDMELVRYGKAP